jgi:hypothetical protein
MTPARNRPPMEVSVSTPYMMKPRLGGMSTARVPAEVRAPELSSSS